MPTVFPVNSVKAMRGCVWLLRESPDAMPAFARAAFESYWGQDEDISKEDVVSAICSRTDVDARALLTGITEQAIKDGLKSNTDELISRGGFGSPTIFLNKTDMYFGNDRMPLIREVMLRRRSHAMESAT